jgi:hypothetical protein
MGRLNSYSFSNEGVETGALIRLGMMVSFLVKSDQEGMGFWAPPSFWEGSVGLGVLGGRSKTLLALVS